MLGTCSYFGVGVLSCFIGIALFGRRPEAVLKVFFFSHADHESFLSSYVSK